MCAGKMGGLMPPLLGLSDLCEPWLTLTSVRAGLGCHLANKHKYSVADCHVLRCSSVDTCILLILITRTHSKHGCLK